MLMEKKTYQGAGFNFRLALLVAMLGAFLFVAVVLHLNLPPETPLGPFVQVQAARLERLPMVPVTRMWMAKRVYLFHAYPVHLQQLDAAMDRAIVAAITGAIGLPLAWALIRFHWRHKKRADAARPRNLTELLK